MEKLRRLIQKLEENVGKILNFLKIILGKSIK